MAAFKRSRAMVEFDVKCRECQKPITLRVRDEEVQRILETDGALCEACYEPGYQPALAGPAAWR